MGLLIKIIQSSQNRKNLLLRLIADIKTAATSTSTMSVVGSDEDVSADFAGFVVLASMKIPDPSNIAAPSSTLA